MEPVAPSSPADPPQDPPAPALPNNIAFLLHAVGTLLGYGRHLIATVSRRATAPNFNAIAACFGTDNLSTILAHLNRGILRATALERVLLARAATGQDIAIVERRPHTPPAQPAPAATQPQQPATEPRKPAPRPPRPTGWNDPELMPTMQELERQVRRRLLGRTILDICLDLAVVPGFCTGEFWNELFDAINCFGGSVASLMQQKSRREQAFDQVLDRRRGSNWDWLRLTRETARQVLGFFIGEPPVDPLEAIATGPP